MSGVRWACAGTSTAYVPGLEGHFFAANVVWVPVVVGSDAYAAGVMSFEPVVTLRFLTVGAAWYFVLERCVGWVVLIVVSAL